MTPPNPASSSSPSSTVAPGPGSSGNPPPPSFNHLEILTGVRVGIGDTFQLHIGAEYRPIAPVSLGASLFSNFSSRPISAALHVGGRIQLSETVALQPTLYGGLSYLNQYGRTAGRLAEDVFLNGLTLFAALEARFLVQVNPWFGVYVSPALTFEGPVGVQSSPNHLISGENPVGSVNIIPFINFGIYFGAVPSAPPHAPEPEQRPQTPPPHPSERVSREAEFSQRVAEQVRQITEGMEQGRRERVEGVIGEVRERIQRLRGTLTSLNNGINRTNRMSRLLDETVDRMAATPGAGTYLSTDQRRDLQRELDVLSTAVDLDASQHSVSSTEESESIRTGLRFISQNSRNLYGQRILRHLTDLRTQLQRRGEGELTQRVDQVLTRLTNFLNHSQGLQASDLQSDVQSIQASLDSAERVGQELNLGSQPAWTELRRDLTQTQEEVSGMVRHVDALGQFGNIFQGGSNIFEDQVDTPARALHTFDAGSLFLENLSHTDRFRDVTVEALRERYSDFFSYIAYNADTFITLHTPPILSRLQDRREWFEAVQRARDLLCRIEPSHARCSSPLAPVPPPERVHRPPRPPRQEPTPTPPEPPPATPPPPPPRPTAPVAPPPPPPPPRRGRDAGTEIPTAPSVPPPPPPRRPGRAILPPGTSQPDASH